MRGLAWAVGGVVAADVCVVVGGRWVPHGHSHAAFLRFVRLLNAEFFFLLLGNYLIRPRLLALLRWSPGKEALHALLLVGQVMVMGAYFGHYAWLRSEPVPLVLYSFIVFGFFIHLAAFLLGFTVVEWGNAVTLGLDASSRLGFLLSSHSLHTALALLASLALTLAGLVVTSRPPAIIHEDIAIKDLPRALEGYRIALVTDVHIGPTVGLKQVERMVQLVNDQKPDTVAIVGDLVDGWMEGLKSSVQPLSNLSAPDGTVYVTGNHEYYHSPVDEWLVEIKKTGVIVLRNTHHRVLRDHAALCFAGVDDLTAEKARVAGHGMDAAAAVAGCGAADIRVLLAHQPNAISRIRAAHPDLRVHLWLAGHTHGGQLYILVPVVYLMNSYLVGHYGGGAGGDVYVSPGVHYGGPPIKIHGLSQIPILTLRRAP